MKDHSVDLADKPKEPAPLHVMAPIPESDLMKELKLNLDLAVTDSFRAKLGT